MFNYILKRLLLMLVTLFGITVITFVITRLAPGDPAALKVQAAMAGPGGGRGQQLSEAIIEENRRILGLDKPIIFNPNPKGRVEHARQWIKDLASTEEYVRARARKALRAMGAVALPTALAALNEAPEGVRRELLDLLPILAATTPPAEYAALAPADKAKWWADWWSRNGARFDPANVRRVVADYLADPSPERWRALQQVGGVAVPFLMPALKRNDPAVVARATAALAILTGKPWSNLEAKSSEIRERNLYRWGNWWDYHRPEYVEFGPVEEFARMFTDTQYGVWFSKILTFDFDESLIHHRPVLGIIGERLPISIQLALISIFISYLIAIPLGIFSATHQFKLSDKIATVFLFILYSLPSFWLADMLILFLTGGEFWYVFPTQGLHSPGAADWAFWPWLVDWLWHLVLPITCLTYASFAFLSRQMRVSMLETIRQDFIRTARAKGLSQRVVVLKHALRNSLIPILTISAALLPELLGGSLIIETIFGIEGMGKLAIDSIMNRDYPVINAIAFFSAFLTLLGILFSDLSYALVDPRIRYE